MSRFLKELSWKIPFAIICAFVTSMLSCYGWLTPTVLYLVVVICLLILIPSLFRWLLSGKKKWFFLPLIIYFAIYPPDPFQRVAARWNLVQTNYSTTGCAVIDYKNKPLFLRSQVLNPQFVNGRYETAYFFYAQIDTHSCNGTLHVISWRIADLQRLENTEFKSWGEIYSSPLEWDASPSIPQKDVVWVSFAHIYSPAVQAERENNLSVLNEGVPQFRFHIARWQPAMTAHLKPGVYRFKLVASFDNAAPAESLFELSWPGKHHDNMELMAHEIQIKRLTRHWWKLFWR